MRKRLIKRIKIEFLWTDLSLIHCTQCGHHVELSETDQDFHFVKQVSTSYASDILVLMPAQHCPAYIAQPAPLPCPREGFYRPYHEDKFSFESIKFPR